MGRIFVASSYGERLGPSHPTLASEGLIVAQELILLRDLVVQYLRSLQYEALSVPEDLSPAQAITWINSRARTGDVALDLQADCSRNATIRGTTLFYIAGNDQRRVQAEQLLQAFLRQVPQLMSQGVKPDIQWDMGYSAFCRQIFVPALTMIVGAFTNPDDRQVIQTQRQAVALGIAEGLAVWSHAVSSAALLTPTPTYPAVNVNLNGALFYGEGILANGNFYIPVDLVDQLGVDLPLTPQIRRLSYRNIVYVRAIDLREFNVSISADKDSHSVMLRSAPLGYPGPIDWIMGRGTSSEVQLMMFLKSHHPDSLIAFAELPRLYREEAAIEGVNYDIAFAQMCVETDFLRFGGQIRPEQNNFASLGGVGDQPEGASFRDARIGVRAHIQHLKAYASTEPLVQESVDPRFRLLRRGVAPQVDQLSGRWSADLHYGQRIKAVTRLLYESAGFL
ncbi:MAG: glucosaminidase domain-containing protein [Synechococcales cyanobacterium C42_A2020_086]|jgi:hypothetical protein|nr:glucosaminidase domain-containing protein [Synechococcales cyanobacterium C42_A2020_086]